MPTVSTEPYRAYAPRPFTRAQRDSTTVLFGGLHWRLERLLQAVLENSGYKARILPVATKEDLLTGREVADIGQCCPQFLGRTIGAIVAKQRHEGKVARTGNMPGRLTMHDVDRGAVEAPRIARIDHLLGAAVDVRQHVCLETDPRWRGQRERRRARNARCAAFDRAAFHLPLANPAVEDCHIGQPMHAAQVPCARRSLHR